MQTLVAWEPMQELSDLRTRVDQMFREMTAGGVHTQTPPIDLIRQDGGYRLRCALPGLDPDEVNIEVEDNQLTISGEHSEKETVKGEDYIRREFASGTYLRSLTLPRDIDSDNIEANIEAGVLELQLPLKEKPESGKIQITPTTGQNKK